jgi:hypothetical protein
MNKQKQRFDRHYKGNSMLTIQHDSIFSVSFMYDPWDFLRHTSPDVLSRKPYPVYIRQSCNSSHRNPQLILENKQTTSDRLIAYRWTFRNPSNRPSNATWLKLSETCNLAVTYFILTCSEVYIPQEFPLLFVIIFLSYSTPANHGYTNTSARWEQHWSRQMNGYYTQYITLRHTARTKTPVSSPQCCKSSHQKYDRGCRFKNRF